MSQVATARGPMAFLPQWHDKHLCDEVFPHVLGCGVTQQQIDIMLVDVPWHVLEGK